MLHEDNIKVSVIMGIYNCSETLEAAIESLLSQTYSNWELIMCDDCSTDTTFDMASSYAKKYSNIKLLKNEVNKGLAASLNECLKHINGQYIARMDADDISLPKRFEKQVEFLNTHPDYSVVGSAVILFDGESDLNIRTVKEKPLKKDIVLNVPHIHPTIMMRREVYRDLKGYTVLPRTRRAEDLDLWCRFHQKGYQGYNLQEPLLKYREGINDYKKRTFKNSIRGAQTLYIGIKSLKLPKWYYFYLLKPLIATLLPNKIMYYYHKKVWK